MITLFSDPKRIKECMVKDGRQLVINTGTEPRHIIAGAWLYERMTALDVKTRIYIGHGEAEVESSCLFALCGRLYKVDKLFDLAMEGHPLITVPTKDAVAMQKWWRLFSDEGGDIGGDDWLQAHAGRDQYAGWVPKSPTFRALRERLFLAEKAFSWVDVKVVLGEYLRAVVKRQGGPALFSCFLESTTEETARLILQAPALRPVRLSNMD